MADDQRAEQNTQIVDVSDSLDEDAVSALVDEVVAGKYKIKRRLARGGMGVVYLAEHTTLGRPVVFKVLSYHLADDERAKSRFEREARGLSVLDHPNVVTVHDFGLEQSLTYIVMEYVEGENLSQRVRRRGRIPYHELLPIAMQTIDAIAAAHEKSIVHRDIKPSNVMVTSKQGRPDFVKVLDFGLAKLATTSVDITKGNLVGTVSYLAPEVIKGADASPASDVYSLGVMFYYLLTGSKPFQADDDMSVLYQHVNVEPEWLGEFVPQGEAPEEFLHFIHHCMEKDPAQRPRDAHEMRQLLGEHVSLPSISAFSIDSNNALPRYSPDSDAERVKRPYRHTRPSGEISGMRYAGKSGSFSISRARPRRSLRVGVIAFTVFSLGFAALAFILTTMAPDENQSGQPAANDPAASAASASVAERASDEARLRLNSTPDGEVSVNGEPRGRTPLELQLTPGRHVVTVTEPGYKPWIENVDIEAAERRRFDIFLSQIGSDEEPRVAETDESGAQPERPKARAVRKSTPAPKPSADRGVAAEETTPPEPAVVEEPPPSEEPKAVRAFEPPADDPEPDQTPGQGRGLLSTEKGKGGLLPVGD